MIISHIKKIVFVFAALLVATASFAQQDDLVLADQLYSKYSFGKAIPLYEKVLSKEYNHGTASKLADCYRKTINIKKQKSGMRKLQQIPMQPTMSICNMLKC
ncbi:MAG: hypothetical protein IPJ93_12670 [Bacteroidota bacterium]|nr:MAG: hypothetical protein IPJ93_12670 [Bacteroidota bacterium]